MTSPLQASLAKAALQALTLVVLCASTFACKSTVLDLRKIDQPVLLGPSRLPSEKVVGAYAASVSLMVGVVSQGQSVVRLKNDPQAMAFQVVGGDPRRGISNLQIDAKAATIYLLLAIVVSVEADVTGTVVEIGAAESRR